MISPVGLHTGVFVAYDLSGLSLPHGGVEMKRTEWLQKTRKMRFEETYDGCKSGRLSFSPGYVIVHFVVTVTNNAKLTHLRRNCR